MAVTVADPNASGKTNRFVGICIQRGGCGLRAWFILRNVIDHQGKKHWNVYLGDASFTTIHVENPEKEPASNGL